MKDSRLTCRACGAKLRRSAGPPGEPGVQCPAGCAQILEGSHAPDYLSGRRGAERQDESDPYARSPFAHALPGRLWPWLVRQTVVHIHRHLNVDAVAVASILITIVAGIGSTLGTDLESAKVWWGAGLLAIAVAVPALTGMSLRNISPSEYARLVLEGRPVDEQFRWASWYMCRLCRKFSRSGAIRELSRLNDELLEEIQGHIETRNGGERRKTTSEILKKIDDRHGPEIRSSGARVREIERKLVAAHMRVERAARMKELIADDHGIDRRRLCDHIFRFSPTLFEVRARKFVVNWWTLHDGLLRRHIPLDRALDLLRENERILRRLRRRSHYLRLLAQSGFLFKHVAVFASRSSVRTSLIAYASAIAEVADRMRVQGSVETNRARMVALYLMQRAHPGIDLHRTLVTLCARGREWCEAQTLLREHDAEESATGEVEERRVQSIKNFRKRAELWQRRCDELGKLFHDPGMTGARSHQRLLDEANPTLREAIKALSGLPQAVVTAIHSSQWEINNNFHGVFDRERDKERPALVVLLGYSHTLRDVVKTVVWRDLGPEDRVFVVRMGESDFGTRLMEFELREDREWYRPGESPQFGVGEGALLESLYASEASWCVYVLLDGDGFDRKDRVVQGLDKHKELDRVMRWAKGRFKTFLVVEGYKIYDDLTQVPDFFRDDLDAISLAESKREGVIVVGDSFVQDL